MLKRRRHGIVALALLIVLAVDSLAQSQQPTPGGRKNRQPEQTQTNKAQQAAAADQRGTEQSPFVIKVLPAENTAPNSDQVSEHRNDKSMTDWLLTVFTGLLVLVGVGQGVVFAIQAHRLKQTVDEMKLATIASGVAANAAKVSSEHIPKVERAYLFGGHRFTTVEPELLCDFWVKNNGKTPGIITEVWVEFLIDEPASVVPIYRKGEAGINGRGIEPDIVLSVGADASVFPALSFTPLERFFVAYIIYVDIFKDTHTSRLCTRFDSETRSWHRAGPPAWNDWD